MVGDMPTDLEYAHGVPGVRAALVLTGITTAADAAAWVAAGGPRAPDFTIPDVAALVTMASTL